MQEAVTLTFWDIINLAIGIASILLAILAWAQATYFYIKGKDTERNVSTALAEIKTQTLALEKLNGRFMDRLTKHVTQSQPKIDDILNAFLEINGKNIPNELPQNISPTQDQVAKDDLIACYIHLHHYTALNNILCQGFIEATKDHSEFTKNLLRTSYDEFYFMDNILIKISPEDLKANASHDKYLLTKNNFQSLVKRIFETVNLDTQ